MTTERRTIDASAELVALSVLLQGRATCSCGFFAEGADSTNGQPVCARCWPSWKAADEKAIANAHRSYEATVNRGPVTPNMKSPPEWLAQSGGMSSCGCLMEANGCIVFQFCEHHFAGRRPWPTVPKGALVYELFAHHRVVARFNALLRGES
jgi:hypothetical protein